MPKTKTKKAKPRKPAAKLHRHKSAHPKPRKLRHHVKKAVRKLRFDTWGFAALALVGLCCAAGVLYQMAGYKAAASQNDRGLYILVHRDINDDFNKLAPQIRVLTNDQIEHKITVVSDSEIQQEITLVYANAAAGDLKGARASLNKLRSDYGSWRRQLDTKIQEQEQAEAAAAQASARPAAARAASSGGVPYAAGYVNVPIVLYHYTPGDFEQQLQFLTGRGYTGIDPDQLANALYNHGPLPAKPVLITFDDGYSNQLQAFGLLQKYGMKATFYIINGGAASNWCIGANRTNTSCGDGYMNWDEIRMLDRSGLITIGSHTVDHENLASLSRDQQQFEIFQGKAELEAQLGHPVRDFAYPYGAYNSTTLQLVRQAGFTTAVSTLPGTLQSAGNSLTLYRIRMVYNLP